MKLTLTDGNDELMSWDLEKDVGDMREPRARRLLYRILYLELVEVIDYQNRWSPPLPEAPKEVIAHVADDVISFLAGLTPEEREKILKGI